MNGDDLRVLSEQPVSLFQPMINTETLYQRFLTFCKGLKLINDNDTNLEDASLTLYLNQQYDVVTSRITKVVKHNHIHSFKDANGLIFYDVYMPDCSLGRCNFISDFQILNSKGDVEHDFVYSGLNEKHKLKKFDVINCSYVWKYNIPFAVRFTFKGEPYPIQYSYTGYIFNIYTHNLFIQNFGDNMFICQ